jgi:hypothetical protein
MKKIRTVTVLLILLVASLMAANKASAAPINPPSAGCTLSNINTTIAGSGASVVAQSFYDDDTLHFTTGTPVTFHITSTTWGINVTHANVTTLTYNFPHTGTYTYSIIPSNGQPTTLKMSCKSTPISGGCIVSNDYFTSTLTLNLDYNAGEVLKVNASSPIWVSISGAASATYPNVTNATYTFPTDGTYHISIWTDVRGATVKGEVTCTRPRSVRLPASFTLR